MDTLTHYDKLIEENNDPFRDPPELQEYMDKWDGQPFIDAMGLDETKNVLEIGIGTGRLAARTAPLCRNLSGIDISPKTIERAAENLSVHQNIRLICADFTEYTFTKKFDVIYSSLTMMHFEDKERFLSKIASLLKCDGVFCLSVDKDQSGYIDMGTRKLKVYPDTKEGTAALIVSSGMMIKDKFESEHAHIFVCTRFPREITDTVKGLPFSEDNVGRSNDKVYIFSDKYVLKVSENRKMLREERTKTDFLSSCSIPGNKSICYVEDDEKAYYLRTYLDGDSLISERFINDPELLTDVLAKIVSILRSLDKSGCTFCSTDNEGNDFVHGDLCLPNIYVTKDNEFAGFLDLGNSGLGDKWYDYAWMLWSLEYNLGTDKYNDILLKKINVAFDIERFNRYIPDEYRGMHYERT